MSTTMTVTEFVSDVLEVELRPWQQHIMRRFMGEAAPEPITAAEPPARIHGDPTLGGDGLRVAVDTHCPHCGWPERWMDTSSRLFGCIHCDYTSDERNA